MVHFPFILHHAEDPDGIISAAILTRYFKRDEDPFPLFFPLRYDTLLEKFSQAVTFAEDFHPAKIIVSDINPIRDLLAGDLISRLAAAQSATPDSVFSWFDHHGGTEQARAQLEDLGIDVIHHEKQCSALLAARYLGLNKDPYVRRLADIAQAHDHAQPGKMNDLLAIGNTLEDIISLANATGDSMLLYLLTVDLSTQQYFQGEGISRAWREYSQECQQQRVPALEQLERSIIHETVSGYDVLFALAPPILSQKPAPRHLRENHDADVIFCLFSAPYRNHLVMGRKGLPLNLVGFCRQLGGGGRNNSGGFTHSSEITEEEYPFMREELKEQLESYIRSAYDSASRK